jgi:hypothetical protein
VALVPAEAHSRVGAPCSAPEAVGERNLKAVGEFMVEREDEDDISTDDEEDTE